MTTSRLTVGAELQAGHAATKAERLVGGIMSTQAKYSAGTTYQELISEERNVKRVYVGELIPEKYTDTKGERPKEQWEGDTR